MTTEIKNFDLTKMALQSRFRKPKTIPAPAIPASEQGPLLLTLKEAAVYIGLPLRQVRSLVGSGIIRRAPVNTKAFRITKAECNRYVEQLDSGQI